MEEIKEIKNEKRTHEKSVTFEVLNAVLHGIATLLAIAALIALIIKGIKMESTKAIVAYSIYGACMILMFLNSTLYHSFTFTKVKPIFQKFDHTAIYLMIAGSYTPYIIVGFEIWYKWIMLAVIWIIAILGIIFEIKKINKFPKLSLVLYLVMGWLSLFMVKPLIDYIDIKGIILLVLGGVFYTVGTLFYKEKTRNWAHFIWHIFVLLGAISMYFSIYLYV